MTESSSQAAADPRIARSRTALQRALLDLAATTELESISVSDITTGAGVSRSTFYDHYETKEQLLDAAVEAELDRAGIAIYTDGIAPPRSGDAVPPVLVAYVEHVYANSQLYRLVLVATAGASGRLHRRLTTVIEAGFDVLGDDAPDIGSVPRHYDAAAMAGAMISLLATAITADRRPDPHDLSSWIWEIFSRQ